MEIDNNILKVFPKMTVDIFLRMDEMSKEIIKSKNNWGIRIGEKAPDFQLPDSNGKIVRLSDYYKNQVIILTFFRGDWCPSSQQELQKFQDLFEKIESMGAYLIAVFPQDPYKCGVLKEEFHLYFPLVSDNRQDTIRDYNLQLTVPQALRNIYLEELHKDISQENTDKSWNFPLPAYFIIDQNGIIRDCYVTEGFSSTVDPLKVLESLNAFSYFEAICPNTPQAMFLVDMSGQIIAHNNSFDKMFDHSHEENMLGINILSDSFYKDREYAALIQEIITGSKSFGEIKEIPFRSHITNIERIINISVGQFVMANKISGVICSIDDITEKVKQHKELERVKAYFETIFKDSPISLFIIDKFGIILDHNKAANMITGCPANYSQVGVNILESHQSQSGEIFSFIKKVLKDEDEFFEFNNVTIDEKVVNFKVTRLVIGKESIGYIIAVEDITDKVCQNQELELALSKIKQQEEKYRQLVESMNSGLITTDSEECLTFVNKSFCEMTGYSQHELIGQKKTDYIDFGMEKDELDKAIQMIKNHEFTEDLVGEITVTKKNGELIYAQCSSTIREDEKGNFIGFADVITDITQRKKTEEALIIAKQKAEVANKTKSEFLSNMSHEIRTPMNAILGFTEILYGIIKDKTQREYISSIASSGKTLLTLINDILDLSKVEAGKLELNCSLVNPYSIFEDMSLIFSHKIAEKGLSYIIDIDPKLPTALLLDETRVRQVLLNLISNAVKFTENGFIKLTVSYEPCEDDEKKLSLLFSVEDTGIGIPQEEIELIFKAFKQSKPRNQSLQSGTGLGLTITKRLIKLMGGEIAVTSELNKGSRFHVIIKNITISDDNPDSLSNELTLPENLIFDPATLLIVDDIKLNRDLVKAYLDPYPFNVIEGENGAQAIKLAESHKPDMIFMDLKMPDMNGFEATKRIKNISGLESTPVIAFTASAMKEIEDEIYQTCDGYLKKPVNKILLLREIAKHISFQCGVSQTQDSAGHCGAEAENLDEKVLSELPDLLSQLEGELKSKWERISDKLVFDDIEGFGDEVKELALQYQYSDLKYWADELKSQVETFDVDSIPKTLKLYPEKISIIKELIKK